MPRGPKPKSKALKVLGGTRADRLGAEPPSPRPGTPTPPDWLGPVARDHWDEVVPRIQEAGVLTPSDAMALAQLCDCYEQMQLVESINQREKLRAMYVRLLIEFGLTPSARSRVHRADEGPKDALGEFLSRRKA